MPIKGIDVSLYQGNINWSKVKADGVGFVFIRAGYATTYEDPTFKQNIEGAQKAGLKAGVYHAMYAKTKEQAEAEATFLYSIIKGYSLDYPIAYDAEVDSIKVLGKTILTNNMIAFFEKIKSFNKSYKIALYTNTNWRNNGIFDWNLLKSKLPDIYLWQAHYPYGTEMSIDKILAAKPKAIDDQVGIWQITDKGRVDGIAPYVDVNYDYTKLFETTSQKSPESTVQVSLYKHHVIDTCNEKLTSGFRTPSRPTHDGMDFVDQNGKQKTSNVYITAFADGTVTDTIVGTLIGTSVSIAHENKILTRYFHMKAGSVLVKVGQKVKKGDRLGIMGTTGDSTGIHLHFAIKENSTAWNNGLYVNPEPYLNGLKTISSSEPPMSSSLIIGSKVKVKNGAKTFTGGSLASFVYNNTYEVYQISGDRIVIAVRNSNNTHSITAAVHIKDLIQV